MINPTQTNNQPSLVSTTVPAALAHLTQSLGPNSGPTARPAPSRATPVPVIGGTRAPTGQQILRAPPVPAAPSAPSAPPVTPVGGTTPGGTTPGGTTPGGTTPGGTTPLTVTDDLVELFGKAIPRKYVYIGLVLLLGLILAYLWWSGQKEDKDNSAKEEHEKEQDDYRGLYQRQQQRMGRLTPEMMIHGIPNGIPMNPAGASVVIPATNVEAPEPAQR